MAKLMLVEDDNNLREIYEARLQAEGYDIVSAHDGEEALVVAKAEKPELIISDVMMPKISGFEMLDIIRNTEGLKDVKVIMLTALGQTDDQQRADRLGADRYLVKSQVTLEDIVKVAHELLQDTPTADAAQPASAAATPTGVAAPQPAPAPALPTQPVDPPVAVAPAPDPAPTPVPAASPVAGGGNVVPQTEASESAAVDSQIAGFVAGASSDPTPASAPEPSATVAQPTPQPPAAVEPPTPVAVDPTPVPPPPAEPTTTPNANGTENSNVPIANKKVIAPIQGPPKKDIAVLLAEEEAKAAPIAPQAVIMPAEPQGPVGADDQIDPHSIAL